MKKMIRLSWNRCKERGLSKDILMPCIVLTNREFGLLSNNNQLLISIFNTSIEQIKHSITGRYLFLLTDVQGVLLAIGSSKQIEQQVKESGIKPGTSFAEESCGTNAISLAVELKKPVYIRPEQHYCQFLKKWYCYAIPLYIDKNIAGYLDISTIDQMMKKELTVITELLAYQIITEYEKIVRNKTESVKNEIKSQLTEQQLEILKLLVKGYTEKAIASELHLGICTIKYHKSNIFKKLGVNSCTQAISKAVGLDLFSYKNMKDYTKV